VQELHGTKCSYIILQRHGKILRARSVSYKIYYAGCSFMEKIAVTVITEGIKGEGK